VNDPNTIAQLFNLRQQVTREQYRQLEFIAQPANQVTCLLYALRIETIGGVASQDIVSTDYTDCFIEICVICG
jgi:hypothetical protein